MLWLRVFVILFITTSPVRAQSPVGLLFSSTFNEGSGGSAIDNSGRGNHLTDGPRPLRVPGVFGQGYAVDLGYGCPGREPSPFFDGTGDMTFAAWIHPTALTANARILDAGDDNTRFSLAATSGLQLTSNNAANFALSTTGVLTVGIWQHVAVTRPSAGTGVKFYVNGKDVTSGTTNSGTPIGSTGSMALGAFLHGGACTAITFDGPIDEVRLYTRLLSASDIASVYQWRPPPPALDFLSLVLQTGARRKVTVTVE
jgi:Concanavalin A-like lectin/glucanases superfamily